MENKQHSRLKAYIYRIVDYFDYNDFHDSEIGRMISEINSNISTNMKIIDLVQKECKNIIDDKYGKDSCKPYVIISMMDFDKYVLTLIHSDEDKHVDYRQSDVITLNTNLEATIEALYNRTM